MAILRRQIQSTVSFEELTKHITNMKGAPLTSCKLLKTNKRTPTIQLSSKETSNIHLNIGGLCELCSELNLTNTRGIWLPTFNLYSEGSNNPFHIRFNINGHSPTILLEKDKPIPNLTIENESGKEILLAMDLNSIPTPNPNTEEYTDRLMDYIANVITPHQLKGKFAIYITDVDPDGYRWMKKKLHKEYGDKLLIR